MSFWEGLQPSTLLFLTLSSCLLKAVNVIGLVSICHRKGGRFVSFREAFGLVTCPLLFFTLPRSLKMPAKYYSLLDLVFFSPEGCECDRASICLLLIARVVGSCHLGRPSA